MAWGKAQLSLGEDTSSPIVELVPSQRAQGKHFPLEKPSGSAATLEGAQGHAARQGLQHQEVFCCPHSSAPGVRACPGRPGSPVCQTPWGAVGCGVVGVGQQARG